MTAEEPLALASQCSPNSRVDATMRATEALTRSSETESPEEVGEYPGHDGSRAALVVAHPGHEIRVHAWLRRVRPVVFVLTDGSGHSEHGRVDSTAEVIARAGAQNGAIFGRLSDRDAYLLISEHRLDVLQTLVLELVSELDGVGASSVISDAVEGFNPVHDLCFVIAGAAVELASRRLGRPIPHYDFWLESAPDHPSRRGRESVRLQLSETEFEDKMRAAESYGALRQDVERSIAAHGPEAFSIEVMRRVSAETDWVEQLGAKPFYERHGERRVAEGVYQETLRFRKHFLPLVDALQAWSASQ